MLGNKSTWCNLLNVIKIILLRLLKILKILFMKISNKAPRFFVSENLNLEEVLIKDKNIIHQLQKVLRKKVSDEVVLLDGEGIESFGVIKEISKKEVVLEKQKMKIHQKENYDDAGDGLENFSKKIILAPVILKKDNFELVIQKCTEIGIKNFQPIISERTEKDNLNFERLEKISREASEQSEKIFLPKIFDTKTLEKFLIEKTQNKIDNYNKKMEGKANCVDAGIQIFRKSVLDFIPENEKISLEEKIFPILIKNKEMIAFPVNRRFYDIGTFKQLKKFNQIL